MSKYLFILICLLAFSACQASKEEKITPPEIKKEIDSPPLSRFEGPSLELPQEDLSPILDQHSLRLESLSALEKASTFSLKLFHAYRYFGAFDFERSNLEEFFVTLKKYEQSENYDALSLGATSKILFYLKDHLQNEYEKDYLYFLNTRYQLSVREALKILFENDHFKALFSWKPRYLKNNNDMTLQECEEVKHLLSNALEVKKIYPQLKLEGTVSKRLKQMKQELPENELFKKPAQEIGELVQELISDL